MLDIPARPASGYGVGVSVPATSVGAVPAPTVSRTGTFAVADLTTRQLERRSRVLAAAYRLAADGGYDAVHIREVAAEAGVALGTLYNYFESKDHLLASLLVEWSSQLERESSVDLSSLQGPTADLLVALLARAMKAMWLEPDVTRAAINALNGPTEVVAACQNELKVRMSRLMAVAFPAEADPVWQRSAIRAIEHVWFSNLLSWVHGWMTPEEVQHDVEAAVRLIVANPVTTE